MDRLLETEEDGEHFGIGMTLANLHQAEKYLHDEAAGSQL